MTRATWTALGIGAFVTLAVLVFGTLFQPMGWAAGHGMMAHDGFWGGWWMPFGALLVWGLAIVLGVALVTALVRSGAARKE